jgi:hypothetical protein
MELVLKIPLCTQSENTASLSSRPLSVEVGSYTYWIDGVRVIQSDIVYCKVS